ncbi:hypothetical protein FQR65_LT20478 [Abscondita terminalis]|nr:hypothetical protein FQR65_LT20478 [Abscondita terminalis]
MLMSQSIFISGAAQGIGAAIARLFYQQGYQVGIYDINEVQAQALADQLGHNAKAGKLDVRDYAQWQKALAEFSEWAQGLNILVNNAGILYSEGLDIEWQNMAFLGTYVMAHSVVQNGDGQGYGFWLRFQNIGVSLSPQDVAEQYVLR